ncbi:MAG: carbonic anhydrase [Cytophagales bacterium]|nr:MAG: carbonic anhydrase [Cytophagales bacterium]
MELYEQVFENNRQWVAESKERDPEYFKNMAMGQSPEFLYIGCADSRVQPEDFMGVSPGQVFVHRNIANLIPNNDMNSLSVVQYAVEHLKVKHIIVCGHYGCGGVAASMEHHDLGKLNIWLRNIEDVYRLYRVELDAILDKKARQNRLVELNVWEQCLNIMKLSFVQRARAKGDYPKIHGWVYDLENGVVNDMKINMRSMMTELAPYIIE